VFCDFIGLSSDDWPNMPPPTGLDFLLDLVATKIPRLRRWGSVSGGRHFDIRAASFVLILGRIKDRNMKILYDEVSRRFPEVCGNISEGNEGLPYVVMGCVADWIKKVPKEALTPELVDRLVSFAKWCEGQPRGDDAGNDLPTILTVSFYEPLFDSDTTRPLLPRFISLENFIAGADYLRTWVGVENYDKAFKHYEAAS
jgi:hypothetical protein